MQDLRIYFSDFFNVSREKEKAVEISLNGLYLMPAITYSPTHFRVQYHRPSGA